MVDQHKPMKITIVMRTWNYLKVKRFLQTERAMCMSTRMYLYNTVCIVHIYIDTSLVKYSISHFFITTR